MDSLHQFLNYRVETVLDASHSGGPPVDLHQIARASGVLSVEDCEMIPEAAICVEALGFRIRLQSNFTGLPGARLRQRFSFAHEIAHTFFYEMRGGRMRPIAKAPRGDRLESACHEGAALILIPDRLLMPELRARSGDIDAAAMVQLADKFEVSVEVMLRRLFKLSALDSTYRAFVLVRRDNNSRERINFAVYPPWLKAILPEPSRDTDFAGWFFGSRGAEIASNAVEITRWVEPGRLKARVVNIWNSVRLYEITIDYQTSLM